MMKLSMLAAAQVEVMYDPDGVGSASSVDNAALSLDEDECHS